MHHGEKLRQIIRKRDKQASFFRSISDNKEEYGTIAGFFYQMFKKPEFSPANERRLKLYIETVDTTNQAAHETAQEIVQHFFSSGADTSEKKIEQNSNNRNLRISNSNVEGSNLASNGSNVGNSPHSERGITTQELLDDLAAQIEEKDAQIGQLTEQLHSATKLEETLTEVLAMLKEERAYSRSLTKELLNGK